MHLTKATAIHPRYWANLLCKIMPFGQFTPVSHFRAWCFMWQETLKCDSSINWNIAVERQKFESCRKFWNAEEYDSWSCLLLSHSASNQLTPLPCINYVKCNIIDRLYLRLISAHKKCTTTAISLGAKYFSAKLQLNNWTYI